MEMMNLRGSDSLLLIIIPSGMTPGIFPRHENEGKMARRGITQQAKGFSHESSIVF
jgi:hypothetical protein